MRRLAKRLLVKRVLYFVALALAAALICALPMVSAHYQELHGMPRIGGGAVLDLAGYDMAGGKGLPLNGEWELFEGKWLVTDNEPEGLRGLPVAVPMRGGEQAGGGIASYRLRLKNVQPGVALVCFVPNLGAAYRVFINGAALAHSGEMSREPGGAGVVPGLVRERAAPLTEAQSELVIEVSGGKAGGLYVAPMLMESRQHHREMKLCVAASAAFAGVALIMPVVFLLILTLGRGKQTFWMLLIICVITLLRVLLQEELFGLVKNALPFIDYNLANMLVRAAAMLLPAAVLICMRKMQGFTLTRSGAAGLLLFEAACVVPMLALMQNGGVVLPHFLFLLSLAPFGAMLRRLYLLLRHASPYALETSAEVLLLVCSMAMADQYASGLLVMNAALYPPACFMLALLLQLYLYAKRNGAMRLAVLKGDNLRLRLRESETALMVSQIQPHFLYNALTAIQVLCTRRPETAAEAVGTFSKYLRANMQSLNSTEPIPFAQELEHVKNYVAIEKLRFGDRLTVRYEVGAQDFAVPALAIQPLVENAIKHGACKNVYGGTVLLRTGEDRDAWWVEISDNGPGFDAERQAREPGEHYGLRNITVRLREMVGATLQIDSTPNVGTKVRVRLPKKP